MEPQMGKDVAVEPVARVGDHAGIAQDDGAEAIDQRAEGIVEYHMVAMNGDFGGLLEMYDKAEIVQIKRNPRGGDCTRETAWRDIPKIMGDTGAITREGNSGTVGRTIHGTPHLGIGIPRQLGECL
jgi:hypothetical protein